METKGKYILDDRGEPVEETNLEKWAVWLEHGTRIVARTQIGKAEICTDFLGLDHNWSGTGEPILWETMVFGGSKAVDGYQVRCNGNRIDALRMHEQVTQYVINEGRAMKRFRRWLLIGRNPI